MEYLKLYEDFSKSEYRKILVDIRNKVNNKVPSDEIVMFINKYVNDTAKTLNDVKLLFNRINKIYSVNLVETISVDFKSTDYISKMTTKVLNKYRGVDDRQYHYYYSEFCFDWESKYIDSNLIEKTQNIKDKLSDKFESLSGIEGVVNLKSLFRKLYKILDWAVVNGPKVRHIIDNKYKDFDSKGVLADDITKERDIWVFDKISDLYTDNYENAYNEYKKVRKSINHAIKQLMLKYE